MNIFILIIKKLIKFLFSIIVFILRNIFTNKKKIKVLVCNNKSEIVENQPYRFKDDEKRIIRFKQDYPKVEDSDVIPLHEIFTNVAGTTFRGKDVEKFIYGKNKRLEVVHTPSPKYENAISIYGIWETINNRTCKKLIGYVPDDESKDIYRKYIMKREKCILRGKLIKIYLPEREMNAGISICVDIWGSKLPNFEIHGIKKSNNRKITKTYEAKTFEDACEMAFADKIIVDVSESKEI